MSKLFGEKDPFDDPFFTDPFAGHVGSRKEITIEELDNDGNVSVPNTQVSKTQAHKSHGRNLYGNVDQDLMFCELFIDEQDGFEENWKVNADNHIPGWNDGFDSTENTGLEAYSHLGWNGQKVWDGWTLPWTDM